MKIAWPALWFAVLGVATLLALHEFSHWVARLVIHEQAHIILPQQVTSIAEFGDNPATPKWTPTERFISAGVGPLVQSLIAMSIAIPLIRLRGRPKRFSVEALGYRHGVLWGHIQYLAVLSVLSFFGPTDFNRVVANGLGGTALWGTLAVVLIVAMIFACGYAASQRPMRFDLGRPYSDVMNRALVMGMPVLFWLGALWLDHSIACSAANQLDVVRTGCG